MTSAVDHWQLISMETSIEVTGSSLVGDDEEFIVLVGKEQAQRWRNPLAEYWR